MKFLEAVETITPITDTIKKVLSSVAREFQFPKNHHILEEGKVCDYLYFVEKGCLRGYTNRDGNMVTYWFALEGLFATSFGSFITRSQSKEGIFAVEDCKLIGIHFEDLTALFVHYHEIEKIGRLVSQNYYLQLEKRTYGLQFLSAKERYDQLITEYPNLIQRVPLGYVASYLGISQETLSRIRAKF